MSGSLCASEPDRRLIEEIIVTAEFVEKSLQDTPIAVSAFDSSTLEYLGIDDIEDILPQVPSLSRDLLDLTIRGIGRNFRVIGGDIGVPSYFYNLYLEEALVSGTQSSYYDLERVEVLRGPQGTLYGRNAIGGAVNYIHKGPTEAFFSEVKTRAGSHGIADLYGVVSGPIIPGKAHYRLVGVSANQGHDRSSRAAPGLSPISDTGGFEDNRIALVLDLTPSDQLDIRLNVDSRYYRVTNRVPLLIGEGDGDRKTRFDGVCLPQGTDCFNESVDDFFSPRSLLNPNANGQLPVNGNGFGKDLENLAYPEFKPDYGYRSTLGSADLRWQLGYGQHTMRLILGHFATAWVSATTHPLDSGLGGRNSCVAPDCSPVQNTLNLDQVSERQVTTANPYRQSSVELQWITNLDGPINVVAGLLHLDLERELDLNLRDTGGFGYLTRTPNWGLIDEQAVAAASGFISSRAPRGIGRNDIPIGGSEVNLFGGNPSGARYWFESELVTKAIAAYLQTNIKITPTFELTLGARWSEDKKNGWDARWAYGEVNPVFLGFESLAEYNRLATTDPITNESNGDPFRLVGFPFEFLDNQVLRDKWQATTWRVALGWQPQETQLYYFSMGTGYRAGGFNLGLGQPFPYSEENVLAYEVGFKLDFVEQRLRLNGSAYFYRYDDHQVSANAFVASRLLDSSVTEEQVFFTDAVRNAPEAENLGAELEVLWGVSDRIDLGLSYSYSDTQFSKDFFVSRADNFWSSFASNENENVKGNELNRAPRNKISLRGNYQIPLGDRGRLNFSLSYAYNGAQYFNVLNDRINQVPSFDRWDFRASWDSAAGRYRLSAFVKNIDHELGIIQLNAGPNFVRTASTTRPRSWGLEFRLRFGDWTPRSREIIDPEPLQG